MGNITSVDQLRGLQGPPGKDGAQGPQGPAGVQGPIGATGVGIASASMDSTTGNLSFMTTDNKTMGPFMVRGPSGKDGVGIKSAMVDAQGNLTFTRTDNSTMGSWNVMGPPGTPFGKLTDNEQNLFVSKALQNNSEALNNIIQTANSNLRSSTMWCADGELCMVPTTYKDANGASKPITGISLNKNWTLKGTGNDLAFSNTTTGNISLSGDIIHNNIKFSNQWSGFPDAPNSANNAEISNDISGFKQLMVVGNRSGGSERRVGIWDTLNVNGKLNVKKDTSKSIGSGNAEIEGDVSVAGNLKLKDVNFVSGTGEDYWVRLLSNPADGTTYNRGLAAKDVWARDKLFVNNRDILAEIDDLKKNTIKVGDAIRLRSVQWADKRIDAGDKGIWINGLNDTNYQKWTVEK